MPPSTVANLSSPLPRFGRRTACVIIDEASCCCSSARARVRRCAMARERPPKGTRPTVPQPPVKLAAAATPSALSACPAVPPNGCSGRRDGAPHLRWRQTTPDVDFVAVPSRCSTAASRAHVPELQDRERLYQAGNRPQYYQPASSTAPRCWMSVVRCQRVPSIRCQ